MGEIAEHLTVGLLNPGRAGNTPYSHDYPMKVASPAAFRNDASQHESRLGARVERPDRADDAAIRQSRDITRCAPVPSP